MRADQIRETYLSFFEQRGHKRMQSASLVPDEFDASVLLTTAGMQPFKPYFRGERTSPAPRLTSVQKCFRTTDIEEVGNTARHLTMFEMLGNFSFGDYFKREAIQFGYELSIEGFGFAPGDVWITVFGGDEELGLGADEEAIEYWREMGVPDGQIVRLGRKDNFWQAGLTGPCGPCSELYLDRGLAFGADDDRPGSDSDRFLEFWNLVFMQYELHDDGSLTELPAKNIDTGMGLDRMAAILQDVESVFETDHFRPLIELTEQLSGQKYGSSPQTTRAMRIIADHSRAMSFLIADGVVPSNEDRGYILRRIMRRCIQQGRTLGLSEFLGPLTGKVVEVMGKAYPELEQERAAIVNWTAAEEESFSRALDQGTALLNELIAEAKQTGTSWIDAGDAFRLHDTYGFPYDMTKEMLFEQGLSVDDQGFEELMDQQRERARSGGMRADVKGDRHLVIQEFASAGRPSEFVGYETTQGQTTVLSVTKAPNGDRSDSPARSLIKLAESPFYAEGGGQVSDAGLLVSEGAKAKVVDVYRVDGDQVLAVELEAGSFAEGQTVEAIVDQRARFATQTHHTATHLLHAALRERLGTHVHQAGSAVRPDKLRFDFTHGKPLSDEDIAWVQRRINGWIAENHSVQSLQMARQEAEQLGAMALFGEKYGDWVRVVEVGDGSFSRELCGGTHVASTGEIGSFMITAEASSAANVRRIEALSGPAATELLLGRNEILLKTADALRSAPEFVADAVADREAKLKQAQAKLRKGGPAGGSIADSLVAQAREISGAKVLVAEVNGDGLDAKELRALADQLRDKLGDAAVFLALAGEGRVQVLATVTPSLVERGVKAGDLAKIGAEILGGGGGGRDTMAQAGGKDAGKLPEALAAVNQAIAAALQ